MKFLDSRRLTGPNLLWQLAGAQIDVSLGQGDDAQAVVAAWDRAARGVLDAVGWDSEQVTSRVFPSGVSLALSAPIDTLYAAVEAAEAAWDVAQRLLRGSQDASLGSEALVSLQAMISEERDPSLLALAAVAASRGVNFCGDDEWTTVGMGRGGCTWATDALPSPSSVAWDEVHDVPSCMVTGTNGKTTTARMLLAMIRSAGFTAGSSTTDRIQVGDEIVDRGDWSGPGGARAVVKDPRVDIAVLETARGGLLRRGLGVQRVDVAVITNVAHDHLGELGVHDLAALTEVKFVVARAADCLVLCADDAEVRRRGAQESGPVIWYGLDPTDDRLVGDSATVENGELVLRIDGERLPVGCVTEIPSCLGGAARHNVRNALAAAAVAHRLGLSPGSIRAGLMDFTSDPDSNPGRLNVFQVGGVTVVVDFAHNPHGLAAVFEMAAAMPHRRLGVLLGQAGDRDDEAIAGLAIATAAAKPSMVVLKQMNELARGRSPLETVEMLERTLLAEGQSPDSIQRAPDELDGAQALLEWATKGDLLILLAHAQRSELLKLVQRGCVS